MIRERHRAARRLFVGGGGVFVYLVWGLAGLTGFGHHALVARRYADGVLAVALPVRHATNAVTTAVMDIRGIDTGEELLLLAAIV